MKLPDELTRFNEGKSKLVSIEQIFF